MAGSCVDGQPATTILGSVNEITLSALTTAVAEWRSAGGGDEVFSTAAEIYDTWTADQYGAAAAPYVRRALELTFEAVTRANYPLHQWFSMQHSNVPSWNYIRECLDPTGCKFLKL